MARLASRSRLTALASALVVAYAAGLIAYLLSLLGPVHNAEQGTLDWRFLLRGPIGEKPADIALVTVDEEADLPYWAPVPRAHLAGVVEALSRGGARLIALDFYLGEHSFDARGDTLLRDAIARAGNVLITSFLDWDRKGEGVRENRPMPFFLEPALDYGYATFFTDTAVESVREGKVAMGVDGKHALSMAGCLFAHARGLDTGEIRNLPWSQRYDALPGSDDDYRRVIDYNGPPYQYYRSLEGEMPGGIAAFHSRQVAALPPPLAQRFFADRIVLVGSGLMDAPDLYRTPFFAKQYDYKRTFGVEIHAHFLHTLLADRQLERPGVFSTIMLVLIPAFLAGLAAVRLRPYLVLPLALLVLAVVWWLGFHAFSSWHLVLPLVVPTLSTGLACLLGLVYVGSTDGRRRSEARDRFAPLVGGRQLQQILDQPEAWTTDGEERIASVLWVRFPRPDWGTHAARETVALFRDCWEWLAEPVFKHQGAIFHFDASGLGAVFGAPLAEREHAVQAVMAAIDLSESWMLLKRDKGWEWTLQIGVDTGRLFVGELCGGERYAYQALGRPVDRARQLAAEEGDGDIRISRELNELVDERVVSEVGGVSAGENWYRIRGRAGAPGVGIAKGRDNPFWKYLGLDRHRDDAISEELLGRLVLFADFNQRELRQIRPLIYHRTYGEGERIFAQGEVGSAMYIIQKGSVDILLEGEDGAPPRLLQRLKEGDFFGELALLSDVRRSAAGVTYEPTELLVIFQSDLYDLIERQPELGVRLIRTLSRIMGERLIRANEEMVRLSGGGDGRGEAS